jgi:TfoX/Sxy family transcriptional regulator of competence genes
VSAAELREVPVEIPKPTEEDRAYFRSLLPDDPAVEVKPMFGNIGAFVNGNMFAGLFGPAVGVRLSEQDQVELSAVDGTAPFGPAERPLGGYTSLPATWRDQLPVARTWVDRAFKHVASLPTKKPKAKAAKGSKAEKGSKAARSANA